MEEEIVKEVRSLMIPLQGVRLIMPDSIILQVLTGGNLIELDDLPSWMLGLVEWQKRKIPVMSFEVATNQSFDVRDDARILVIKSVNNTEKMPFYALVMSGIPHPVRINDGNISSVENARPSSPVVLNDVLVEGEPACIPNVDAIEEMLISQYGVFAQQEPSPAA